MKQKRLILVLGMHRSGTSLTAQLISRMGGYIGKTEELIPPRPDNSDGFFENQRIVDVDDALLRRYKREYDTSEKFKIDVNDPYTQDCILQLSEIIGDLFKESDTVCVKDPRICLLLPVYQKLFHLLDVKVRYIYILRNPNEVAQSLLKRNGFPIEHGLDMWKLHNLQVQRFLFGKRHFTLYYTELLAGRRIDKLHRFAFGSNAAFDRSVIEGCVKRSMRHHAENSMTKEQMMIYHCRLTAWAVKKIAEGKLLGRLKWEVSPPEKNN